MRCAVAATTLLAFAGSAAATGGAGSPFSRFQFPNVPGLSAFSSRKFGLFVHWGPVSQWGSEISFPLVCTSFPCNSQGPGGLPITIHNVSELEAHRQAYRDLAQTFNPVAFNATALTELAYNAGFRYLTWVSTHCDGFSNWASVANKNYSIMTTPFGKDTLDAMVSAFRSRGMAAGVYVCPSFWNRDDYFYPDALTSFGTCCQPNYVPANLPASWSTFVQYLHGELSNLATQYQPDHYWIDSGTYPPMVDTHLEQLVPIMRGANPNAVMQVRDGGVWHDFIETVDHSENDAHDLMGMSYIRPGDVWEVPGTLGDQWAYDPRAVYKDASTVIRSLIGVVAKGGNFVLNIGLDSTGVWAPAAVTTLVNMSAWFSFNSEAIYNTTPAFPYEYFRGPLSTDSGLPFMQYFTQSTVRNSTYVFLVDEGTSPISPNQSVILPSLKPSTLSSLPVNVTILTPSGPAPFAYTLDETGLAFAAGEVMEPVPILLGTYYMNYSAAFGEDAEARNAEVARRGAHWPGMWWKKSSRVRQWRAARSAGVTADVTSGGAVSPWRRPQSKATGMRSAETRALSAQVAIAARQAAAASSLGQAALVDHAPCGLRTCSVYTTAGYSFVRNEGLCYRSASLPGGEPSVPVQLLYNNLDDNLGAVNAPSDGQSWQDVDVECYAYANPGPNRIPLELWHSAALAEYWTLADPASRAQAQAMGYTLVQTVGYVEPAPSGGLTPQQQAAVAASYAYVVRLDWS